MGSTLEQLPAGLCAAERGGKGGRRGVNVRSGGSVKELADLSDGICSGCDLIISISERSGFQH